MGIWNWLVDTLRSYPELAIFLALAIGFWIGPKKLAGFSARQRHGHAARSRRHRAARHPGARTRQVDVLPDVPVRRRLRRRAAVLPRPQQGRPAADHFLGRRARAVPRSCRSSARSSRDSTWDTRWASTPARRRSRRRSASRPTRSTGWDSIRRRRRQYLDAIPVGYAVTYIFGTIGSAIILAQLGPKLIGVDLAAACARVREADGRRRHGVDPGVFSAYRNIELRAYRVDAASGLTGKPVRDLFPGLRIFVERVRRGDQIIEADAATVLQPGDVVVDLRAAPALVEKVEAVVPEVDDRELLDMPVERVDVFVTNKAMNGKTLRELADVPDDARHLPAQDHAQHGRDPDPAGDRNPARRHPDDRRQRRATSTAVTRLLGHADRPVESTDHRGRGCGHRGRWSRSARSRTSRVAFR